MPRSASTALAATVAGAVMSTCLVHPGSASAVTARSEAAAAAKIDTLFTFRKVKVQACVQYKEPGIGRLKTRADARKLRGDTLATYYVEVDFGSNDSFADRSTVVPGRRTKTSKSMYVGGPENYTVKLRVVFDNGPRKSRKVVLTGLKTC